MNPHRRRLLHLLAGGSAIGASGLFLPRSAWAARTMLGLSAPQVPASLLPASELISRPSTDENLGRTGPAGLPNVVVVFLRGAADSLSMLVPYNDPAYYAARPTLAIARADCAPLTTEFGVHPALKDSFQTLYQAQQAVFVPMGGQEDTTRSHFESQNNWEGGVGTINHSSGFLGRLTEVLGCRTVSFTENLPVTCASPRVLVPTKTFNPIRIGFSDDELQALARQYLGHPHLADMLAVSERTHATDVSSDDDPTGNAPPGRTMGRIATYMRENGTTLAFTEILNWDTHAHEGAVRNGKLPDLLATLNAELLAFRQAATDTQWANTLIVVATEFGRKVRENGTGTDHGHGSLLSFFGGTIARSRIAGEWLPLNDANLFEGRDVPMHHEYRQMLGGVFQKLYGLTPAQVDHVFPGRKPVDMAIV